MRNLENDLATVHRFAPGGFSWVLDVPAARMEAPGLVSRDRGNIMGAA